MIILHSIPLWLCYFDDTFTTVHKDEIKDFPEHLERQNVDIQFTRKSRKMVKYLFQTAWSLTTTDYMYQRRTTQPLTRLHMYNHTL